MTDAHFVELKKHYSEDAIIGDRFGDRAPRLAQSLVHDIRGRDRRPRALEFGEQASGAVRLGARGARASGGGANLKTGRVNCDLGSLFDSRVRTMRIPAIAVVPAARARRLRRDRQLPFSAGRRSQPDACRRPTRRCSHGAHRAGQRLAGGREASAAAGTDGHRVRHGPRASALGVRAAERRRAGRRDERARRSPRRAKGIKGWIMKQVMKKARRRRAERQPHHAAARRRRRRRGRNAKRFSWRT